MRITKLVEVELSEIIAHDHEGFLDILAEGTGYPLLMDIWYEIVGFSQHSIILSVSGEVEEETDDN